MSEQQAIITLIGLAGTWMLIVIVVLNLISIDNALRDILIVLKGN